MSTCKDFKNRITDFVDYNLNYAESTQLIAHLKNCVPCMQDFQLIYSSKKLIGKSHFITPPPRLKESILEKLRNFSGSKASR